MITTKRPMEAPAPVPKQGGGPLRRAFGWGSAGSSPIRRAALIGAAGIVLLTGLSLLAALAMRGDLERGRSELTAAEELLLAGNVADAAAAFDRAAAAFDSARATPGVFLLHIDGWIPLLGRTPDALIVLADMGRDLSLAGGSVAHGIARLPGGLSGLGPVGGRLPVEALTAMAPTLQRARAVIDQVDARARRLPGSFVLGPVRDARELVQDKLARAVPLIHAADALVHRLPAFAGATGPVRYFVAPQNLAEARGTGGLIGNYAVLTMDHGRFSMGPFSSVEALRNLPAGEAPAANPLYDAFGGGGFWLNLNMTPDAPSAATMIESLYERTKGERLDGTLFVDLHAMASMLEVTGPVRIEELHATVTAENVVEFVSSAQYRNIPWNYRGIGRQTLGPRLVADAILGTFFGQASGEDTLRALVEAASGGHIVLHSAHPEVQAALEEAGIAGSFAGPAGNGPGDLFGVVANNAAANKVDYYMHRTVRYDVRLGREGRATAHAQVSFENQAPIGPPSYALGPNAGTGLAPGESQAWTSFYCPRTCSVSDATADGAKLALARYDDLGLSMYAGFLRVKPQRRLLVDLTMDLPQAWEGGVAGGAYRLRIPAQPSIQPEEVTVVVHAPPGMHIEWTSLPMQVQGSTATWTGTLQPGEELRVRFAKPALLGAWSRLVHFLSRPAIKL
jgi:uncharacterized protein DUF4012